MATFEDLMRRWDWREIPNCPGRYRLQPGRMFPRLEELVGTDAPIQAVRVPTARDEVLLVCFTDGGGLITYRRSNGTLVHTLNTKEGFDRKLRALGIPQPSGRAG